jgi:hypothetical protein
MKRPSAPLFEKTGATWGLVVRNLVAAAIILLTLIPLARLAWNARDMPLLGGMSDDATYLAGAKSLAEGTGYRIMSLPDEPFQTKYPPLFPWLLSFIWRIDPHFPSNLPLAAGFAWIMFLGFAISAWFFYREIGFGALPRSILCAMLMTTWIVVLWSVTLFSDFLFTGLLLVSLILAERAGKQGSSGWVTAAAGAVAGLAYLTRTAALPLLLSAPLCYAISKQYRRGALFVAAMSPAVVSWTFWMSTHLSHRTNAVSLYETDYVGYYLYDLSWRDLPAMISMNALAIFYAIRNLLILTDDSSLWFAALLSAGCISGVVRLCRLRGLRQYPLFACLYTILLVVWHFQPNGRFLIPLLPLLLAGFWVEVNHLSVMIRSTLRSSSLANRSVALLLSAGLLVVLYLAIDSRRSFVFRDFPAMIDLARQRMVNSRAAYEWISKNLPADASILSSRDAQLFLYSGRHSACQPLRAKAVYRGESQVQTAQSAADIARQLGIGYYFVDFHERPDVKTDMAKSPHFRQIYTVGEVALFQLQRP